MKQKPKQLLIVVQIEHCDGFIEREKKKRREREKENKGANIIS
jgi:hypothetical protein